MGMLGKTIVSEFLTVLLICGCVGSSAARLGAQSAGGLENGLSAASVARGGTMVAESGDALEAVEGNPAGLAGIQGRVGDVSGIALLASGSFRNSVSTGNRLSGGAGALPYGALGVRMGDSRWRASLAVTPDSLIRVNWRYPDPAGTAGVSYGLQTDRSEIVALRSSAGLGWTMGRKLSAGATVGLDFNQNELKTPYIFQEQPQLKGLKVLLDLKTQGFGWNGSAGVQWHPQEGLDWDWRGRAPLLFRAMEMRMETRRPCFRRWGSRPIQPFTTRRRWIITFRKGLPLVFTGR